MVTISDTFAAQKTEIATKEVPIVHTETKTITYEAAQVHAWETQGDFSLCFPSAFVLYLCGVFIVIFTFLLIFIVLFLWCRMLCSKETSLPATAHAAVNPFPLWKIVTEVLGLEHPSGIFVRSRQANYLVWSSFHCQLDGNGDGEPGVLMTAQTITSESLCTTTTTHITKVRTAAHSPLPLRQVFITRSISWVVLLSNSVSCFMLNIAYKCFFVCTDKIIVFINSTYRRIVL